MARNLSEDGAKVRVVFRGDGASTNGTTIFLPTGDHLSVMQPQECGVLAGYVDHEAEHIASTDMDLWNSEIGVADSFRRELCNAIEDMRIEKIAVRKNPGSFANLSDTTENVCQRELKELRELKDLMPAKLESKRFILPGAVTWEGRKRAGMHSHLQQQLLDLCSQEIRDEAKKINDLIAKARDGRMGTHDAWALAKAVADSVEDEEDEAEMPPNKDQPCDDGVDGPSEKQKQEEKEKQEQESSEQDGENETTSAGDDDGESDDDEGDAEGGEDDNETKSSKDGDDQDGESGNDDDDNDGNKDGNNDDTKAGDDDGEDGDSEGEAKRSSEKNGGQEQVEQSESTAKGDTMGGRGASLGQPNGNVRGDTRAVTFVPVVNSAYNPNDKWIPFTTENDLVVTADSGPISYSDGKQMNSYYYWEKVFDTDNVSIYDELLAEMGPHIHTMRAKLRRALLSKLDRKWDGGYSGGRLDSRRLVDAVRGVPEVFKQREPEQFMDTAVQIVIDLSGSMGIRDSGSHPRIVLAAMTAIAIANALEGTGVEYEIIGFQEPGLLTMSHELYKETMDAINTRGAGPATYSRWLCNMMVVFKPFERRLRDCRAALGGIKRAAGGSNNDIDALIFAQNRLMKREETRKVMIVLSDGKPATFTDLSTDMVEQMLRKTVAQIEKEKHIQIVGIGIDSDCVAKFYRHYSVLNQADELPRTVIDHVAKMLLGARYQVDNAALLGAA